MRFEINASFEKVNGETITGDKTSVRVESGSAGTWTFRIKLVDGKLAAGESVKIQRYGFQIAHHLQDSHPERRDYITFDSPPDAKLRFTLPKWDLRDLEVAVADGVLRCGDEIVFKIGDRSGGSVGSEVFWTAARGRIHLLKTDGEDETRISDDYFIDITHNGSPDIIRVLGPTVVEPGEEFSMFLVIYDINRNPVESFEGEAVFSALEEVSGCPAKIAFASRDKGVVRLDRLSMASPGVHRIGVRLPNADLNGISNPIVCEENPSNKIYWGDLHAHGWGDCSMLLMHDRNWKCDPGGRHEQARKLGRFDYAAPGAMSMPDDESREKIWDAYLEAFDKNDEPGKYVPFMAMEMHPGAAGDRTMIFRDRVAEVPKMSSMRADAEELYKCYGDRDDTLLETHIGGAPPYFETFRPRNEKLVEVSSAFGNAEWLLQKTLEEGYKPAITGASDLHLGFYGAPRAVETFRGRFRSVLNIRDSGFGSGPAGALIASELTRDELWKSLVNRRGYATSGDRLYINLNAGGYSMGDAAELPESFDLRLRVHAQTNIERIDLIVGDRLAESWFPDQLDFRLEMRFKRSRMPYGKWFYFRVKQDNWEYAWTAPVWFANNDASCSPELNDWPLWNHAEPPAVDFTDETRTHLRALEAYLETEGDREVFGEILPVRIARESMGECAVFISELKSENSCPITIRWFFKFEIPKIRVDYGYENFGPVDCHRGPST
ncbi:MAG: hypothetical protein KAG97_02865 [Victivallales bacterium]|nr:hypothetical protein [Victivallales bacterium]